MNKAKWYPPEFRERAVRLVFEHDLRVKIGCKWV
jgi:transposase-like protein